MFGKHLKKQLINKVMMNKKNTKNNLINFWKLQNKNYNITGVLKKNNNLKII